MFSINHWCAFATAEALLVPRDEWDAFLDRGDPRRVEMFIFEFGLATQRDGEPLQVPAPPADGRTAMHN